MLSYTLLQPSEYARLSEHPYWQRPDVPHPDPECSVVFIVEDEGKIIAFVVGQAIVHVEPWWIDEEYRKVFGIAPRLASMLRRELKERGVTFVMCAAEGDRADMLQKGGFTKQSEPLYGGFI